MNKKLVAVVLLGALAPMSASYADSAAGCGAGSIIFKGQKGLAFHVLAATTNGSFGNQTFGMSTGTLGCNANGEVTADAQLKQFASANLDQLSSEMAAGEGESLATLASLYKVEATDRAAFFTLARANYGSIFSATDVSADQVVASLNTLLASDAQLSRYAI